MGITKIKIFEYILILGAIQGILLSVLLFTKKENQPANLLLAFAMLALSFDVFNSAYIMFGYYGDFPHFTGITYSFPFLYGPIFFIYTKLISNRKISFDKKDFLHFIPFLIVVIYGLVFVYPKSADFKLGLIASKQANNLPALELISYLKPIHGIIYVLLTIGVVKSFNEKIKNSYSNLESINLKWLQYLTIGLSIVWSIVAFTYFLNFVDKMRAGADLLIYTAASVLIYSIGYFSLKQPQIFESLLFPPETDSKSKTTKDQRASYNKSGLTDEIAKNHLNKLIKLMETEKPFLNSELTLRELAEKLSISPHNLSELLNTKLNKNFYDFINHYRIEEFKRRLSDPTSDKFSLIALAFDSGFNSKSTFNTIFKKFTGITPSQYRKQFTQV